jgi:hypothetical protein
MESLRGLTDIGIIAMAMVLVVKEIFGYFKSQNVAALMKEQNQTLNDLVLQIKILVAQHQNMKG